MPSARPRRRSAGGARLVVTVTAPDGGPAIARGLSAWLGKVAPATARGEVTVAIISDGRMRTLNRSFRNKNYATDVLSFPVADGGEAFSPAGAEKTLGDIVIASGVAERQADAAGHSLATELKVLALHGLLHLLGYDHETDSGEMARVEARLRRKGGLDASLTERGALDRSGRPSGTTPPSGKRSLEATVPAPKRRRTR